MESDEEESISGLHCSISSCWNQIYGKKNAVMPQCSKAETRAIYPENWNGKTHILSDWTPDRSHFQPVVQNGEIQIWIIAPEREYFIMAKWHHTTTWAQRCCVFVLSESKPSSKSNSLGTEFYWCYIAARWIGPQYALYYIYCLYWRVLNIDCNT